MPLRDHFRPPLINFASWEGFHGVWPTKMIEALNAELPEGFRAEPRVHLGRSFELDVNTYEHDNLALGDWSSYEPGGTATFAPPAPTLVLDDADIGDEHEYEVLVFDENKARQLVAAVEIVSPANKDRPDTRRSFVAKCAVMLKKGVCVSVVDPVTTANFNLYADLLDLLGRSDPAFAPPPETYAVTLRRRDAHPHPALDIWAHPLAVGGTLPTLPVWITPDRMVPLDLETSYAETCRVLRIR